MNRPLTYRMTWAAWRWVDAAKAATVKLACVCAIGTFWMLLGVLLAAGATP